MNRHRILLIVGVLLLVGAVGFSMYLSRRADDPEPEEERPAEQVRTLTVRNRAVPTFIELTGRLVAEDRIDLYSEVAGVLLQTNPPFRAGNTFAPGQTLIRIDDAEFRQSLIASRSAFLRSIAMLMPDIKLDFPASYPAWLTYLDGFEPTRPLPSLPPPATDQERYFLTGRNIYTQFYEIRQMEVRLGKYRIRAPFRGTVAQADITTGTLVQQGQKLGEFIRSGRYELEAVISPDYLPYVREGQAVTLRSGRPDQEWQGRVARLGEQVDQATQAVRVFVRVTGEDLREGMFLTGTIEAETFEQVEVLPRRVLLDEDRVFVIRDGRATLQPVEVLHRTDTEAVVRGLPDGAHVIEERRTGAFEGTAVEPMPQEEAAR
jgi:membrane fusion protein, multidrug efflux system